MAVGKEIRNQISSIKSTQKITSAMEMVAASKMRKAQDRMQATRPYAEKMRQVIGHIAKANAQYKHPFMVEREVRRVGYIVVSTDRGLCGGLNVNLFKALVREMRAWKEKGVESDLCAIGQKGASFFRNYGGNVVAALTHLGDQPSSNQLIGNVKVMLAGLGRVNGSTVHYPKHFDFRPAGGEAQVSAFRPSATVGEGVYPVVTIDVLFGAEGGRTLVLAHLDLEGREPDALRGARATLRRDRPVVTVETYDKTMRHRHKTVMALLEELNYAVYTVEESVGTIRDGRNRIAIPREDRHLREIVEQYFAAP